jgi:membrane-associated protease RseP (regulator of RpoE activity)
MGLTGIDLHEVIYRMNEELKARVLGLINTCTIARQRNEVIYRGELASPGSFDRMGLKRAISEVGGSLYTEEVGGKIFLVATFPESGKARKKWGLNLMLFLVTVVSTVFVGAVLEEVNPMNGMSYVLKGVPFSITIMGILGLHELGHYFAARRYGLDVSLPYFIPFPTLLGTMGAFIKMRSPIHNRRMLLEIGAAGPLAGLVASIPAVIYGLSLSTFQPVPAGGEGGLSLGSSLLFSALERLVVGTPPEGRELFLNPVAFAGWAGLFVTALNLLPIGQLDGGHVSYALFGPLQRKISLVFFLILVPLGIWWWQGWLVWIVLIIFLVRIAHPPVIYEEVPIGKWRKVVGWVVILTFILTFIPAPLKL